MAVLCLGLLLMSSGAAQVFPCMAALVSLYSPLEEQGRLLGIYRSLGALARAVGPLAACMLFWRFGPAAMYVACAAFLLAPLAMVARLPHAEGVAGDVAA
jgi:MFS family permease